MIRCGHVSCIRIREDRLNELEDLAKIASEKSFHSLSVNYRKDGDDPFGMGCWLIDIFSHENVNFPWLSFKLPKTLTHEYVMQWVKDFMDRLGPVLTIQ